MSRLSEFGFAETLDEFRYEETPRLSNSPHQRRSVFLILRIEAAVSVVLNLPVVSVVQIEPSVRAGCD